jgi:hypothetical protein
MLKGRKFVSTSFAIKDILEADNMANANVEYLFFIYNL